MVCKIIGVVGAGFASALAFSFLDSLESGLMGGLAPLVMGVCALAAFYCALFLEAIWIRPYIRRLVE